MPENKKHTLLDRLPKNDEEFLELRINHAKKMIGTSGNFLDEYFSKLAERLEKELEETRRLRKGQQAGHGLRNDPEKPKESKESLPESTPKPVEKDSQRGT